MAKDAIKDPRAIVPPAPAKQASEQARPPEPRLREMSLARARKLIRKTSAQHDGLFRRLAQ